MKTLIIVFFFLQIVFCQSLFAQSEYTFTVERSFECISYCSIATDNNEVMSALKMTPENGDQFAEIIKINNAGVIVDSLLFPAIGDTIFLIAHLAKSIRSNHYIGVGWKRSNDNSRYIWIFEFDDNLQLHWEKVIDTLPIAPLLIQIRHWNGSYFLSTSSLTGTNRYNNTFYKLGIQGEILKKQIFEESTPVYYIRNIPESQYFLRSSNFVDHEIFTMDSALNHVSTITFSVWPYHSIQFPFDLEFIDNEKYILSGTVEKGEYDFRRLLAIKKTDTLSTDADQIRKFGYEGSKKERGCYPGALKALAMQDDYFFVGGFSDRNYDPHPYGKYDNFVMVYGFNHALDSLWSTYLGNDGYYTLYYVDATPDGGCVLTTWYYDWRSGFEKTAVRIFKIAKPDFLNAIQEPSLHQPSVSVYPNPGKDQLHIKTELSHFTFQLYDMQGRLILTQNNGKEINMQFFPVGLYTYRVIDENGAIVSGKWVKQ